jgi:hypothetical protein
MIVNTSEILNKILEIQINFLIFKINNMGKMKEMFGQLEQQDMLDADYQYEQWLENQRLENEYYNSTEFKEQNKNVNNGNIE